MQHCYSLDLRTQQIWDYVGDTYVHRLNHSKADGKLSETNSGCESFEGDCGTYGYSEESGIGGALLNSKVEAVCSCNAFIITFFKSFWAVCCLHIWTQAFKLVI